MDFSPACNEASTGTFLNEVGDLFSERRDELEELCFESCKKTWAAALKSLRPCARAICKHEITEEEEQEEEEERYATDPIASLRKKLSSSRLSSHTQSTSKSLNGGASDLHYRNSYGIDIPDGSYVGSGIASSSTTSSHAVVIGGASSMTAKWSADETSASSISNTQPTSTGRTECRRCEAHKASTFPFVSDVAPLAILMFLEAIQNHNELAFNPMSPAYIPHRPKYLSNGWSFRVTHVPWEQVRADTDGRVVNDAVYKRLNRTASRGAWLDFMKDVVVTHHMTYHVPNAHKRNIVQLVALGWERVLDDVIGEPTLAPVIALEYASYGTLQDLYYSSEFLSSYSKKVQILADVADGLQALHYSNIVHGDVKPANILICKDKNGGVIAKLSDFGLSVIDPSAGPEYQRMPGGTAEYLAPEAHREIPREHLIHTDVYSFGIVVWQTMLGGIMPFFSPKYASGELLSTLDIKKLKCGQHAGLLEAYGVTMHPDEFQMINEGEELEDEQYDPPEDRVNDLLVAMMHDNITPLCRPDNDGRHANGIPVSELGVLTSIIQICLSSCPLHRRIQSILVLLGRKLADGEMVISKIRWESKVDLALTTNLRYQKSPARARELYSTIFEQFFVTLQKKHEWEMEELNRWDGIIAKHVGAALVDFYLAKYLEGDRSEETRRLTLSYLSLSTSLGNSPLCVAGLGLHQLLQSPMEYFEFYTVNTAAALWCGDTTFWNVPHPDIEEYHKKLTKGHIVTMQQNLDETQNQICASIITGLDLGPFDINYQDEVGCTVLHLATQSGNPVLMSQLIDDHGASADVEDEDEEQPIHWVHCILPSQPESVEIGTYLLVQAGADVDAFATPREGGYFKSTSNVYLYPTPLLRAVACRNYPAVKALVRCRAAVGMTTDAYIEMGICPLTVACSMLEYESLDIMFQVWDTEQDPRDPENKEVRDFWEQAIGGGLDPIDRIRLHGHNYPHRVRRTLAVLTHHLGRAWLVRFAKASLLFAVECGDLVWVEALLEDLYKDPGLAVLADLQTSIHTAVACGYTNIAAKLMEYGALPLLPLQWSDHNYTVGRHGQWNEELVDRLVNEMYRKSEICAQTTCCLHFLARGGANSLDIAKSILGKPVANLSLKPLAPDFVTKVIEGKWPRLDRPDEEHRTPLYEAMAYSEFALAQHLIDEGASYAVREWSLLEQLFEDARSSLPQQIEFLAKQGKKPAFKMQKRVFGRLNEHRDPFLHPEPELENWKLEQHTIVTALADACSGFDEANKRRCWRAVLKIYNSTQSILAKAEDGRNAMEIAIDAVDLTTVEILTSALRKLSAGPECFDGFFERARTHMFQSPPARIADDVRKTEVIRYRLTLGKIMKELRELGDQGLPEGLPEDASKKLLENIANEFPILATGFQQRGVRNESIREFKAKTKDFINSFLLALTSRQDKYKWIDTIYTLEDGLDKQFRKFFIVSIREKEAGSIRSVQIDLTARIGLRASSTGRIGTTSPHTNVSVVPRSPSPVIHYIAYRQMVIANQRITDPSNTLPLPEIPNAPLVIPSMKSFYEGKPPEATALVTPVEIAVFSNLRSKVPNRQITLLQRQDRDTPKYYHTHQSPSPADIKLGIQLGKSDYFAKVVKVRNPSARDTLQHEQVRSASNLVVTHAENMAEARLALANISDDDLHPLFGKMKLVLGGEQRGKVVYSDLPIQAYIDIR
ncbi:hypothetical protein BU24DRAFT_452817 [Aaosphaeria arxii CBS 175.79]|uniref:Protein kinase domain-containing protein n=1 Tax=Aaosphaeria arxii CBS 175.79 TaxID=1450172 RepID=A0A6A5XLL9_9PLEO|nr:uncharacterized protein BU24DRAFT_452817 [Aaosphaeria arxii CBS 175.79]KAF2014052.1 hypothetical protein BU24DRAFT_452817 [Aaosphaeria arxii CBS 175.79]